ncbi:MAG: PEP-CTERM sorting domain-containing protein [Pseudomonadota bacterium]
MRATRVLLPLALSMAACTAQADLLYTFDTGAQGFTVTSGGALYDNAGYLAIADIDNQDMDLIVPLAAGTTDWSGYLGGTLSLDAINLNGWQESDWPTFGLIRLTSATAGSVAFDFVPVLEPTSEWKTYSVRFDDDTFGPSLAAVLASLTRVTINLESGNGPIEYVGIDNVRITSAVPEPQTWAMGLAGLALVGGLSRRKRG